MYDGGGDGAAAGARVVLPGAKCSAPRGQGSAPRAPAKRAFYAPKTAILPLFGPYRGKKGQNGPQKGSAPRPGRRRQGSAPGTPPTPNASPNGRARAQRSHAQGLRRPGNTYPVARGRTHPAVTHFRGEAYIRSDAPALSGAVLWGCSPWPPATPPACAYRGRSVPSSGDQPGGRRGVSLIAFASPRPLPYQRIYLTRETYPYPGEAYKQIMRK